VLRGHPKPHPLYRVDELPPTGEVLVLEGEGCVDAAWSLGLPAVTSGSASSARHAIWSPLRGRDVVILPDADAPGRNYAHEVGGILRGLGCRVRILDLYPERNDGWDLANLLRDELGTVEAGQARAILLDRIAAAPLFDPAEHPALEPPRSAVLRRVADIQPEPLRWLWPGRIPLGMLTLLAGDPVLGKSLLSLAIAARVSTGAGWPDLPEQRCEPGGVLMLTAEDDVPDTVRPRLEAAGGDLERVVLLEGVRAPDGEGDARTVPFSLGIDPPVLEDAIRGTPKCRLVIIDHIFNYLSSGRFFLIYTATWT
jgi:hypothetical protein